MQYGISDYQTSNLEGTVRKLEGQQHRLDDLENSVDELRNELESLQRAVEDNESTTQGQTRELEEKLEELESGIDDATRTLSRLSDRMSWAERHIRASGGATEVNFDDQASALKSLVRKVNQTQQAQAQHLDDADRYQLEASVAEFQQRATRIDELTVAALHASGTLTATSYGDDEHTKARKAFRAAFEPRQSEIKLHQQHQNQAEQARTRLAQDEQLRTTHAAIIQAGENAAQTMRTRLRKTITEALGGSALPSVWFATVLGITPPGTGTDEWLKTATELVAYRITYGVTDPVLALGATPDINTGDRYWLHRKLADRLRQYTS